MRRVASNGDPKRFNQARRPRYLFSGLTKCAECGRGYVMYWRDRLACFGARSRGHVYQSPDDQPPGGGRTRAGGATRQADAPGSVRGLLPGIRARVESPAHGAPREPDARSPRTRCRRARAPKAHSGHQGRRLGVVQSRTSSCHSKPGRWNFSRASTPQRCRSCCIRECPTSIARRLAASVSLRKARRAALAQRMPFEHSSRRSCSNPMATS